MEDFAIRIKTVIDSVSKRARIVHLFISAQSAVVFTLGRMYQEGMHGSLVIHNYNPSKKGYPWAFNISNGLVSLYER